MEDVSDRQRAAELLQQLGLKEYEAKCFVALTRLPKATAKDISETSDVPRTRVYDAIRALETKGLVETQHSNPQQFRAVPIAEAVEVLRREYDSRTEALAEALENVEPASLDRGEEVTHEVWSLSGVSAIEARTRELVGGADREIVLIVGRKEALTEELVDRLREQQENGVDVVLGAATEQLRNELQESLPEADVFTSELAWLRSSPTDPADETAISRLLLVDRNTILVSSIHETDTGEIETEQAVFGKGFENGLVVILRRLMATGLTSQDDPGVSLG
jgi:sugar-specific transcriptional regulator TrmB